MVENKTPSGLIVDVKIKMIKVSAGMKVFPVEKASLSPCTPKLYFAFRSKL